jgi:hypothetical protein
MAEGRGRDYMAISARSFANSASSSSSSAACALFLPTDIVSIALNFHHNLKREGEEGKM